MRYEEIVIWRIHMKILPHQRQVITTLVSSTERYFYKIQGRL